MNSIIENNSNIYFYFFVYFIVINIISFLLMWYDKYLAKNNKWRISEKTLFIFSLAFGSIGIYAGMYKFRHKTKHLKFTIGIPIVFVINISCIIFAIKYLL